MTSSARLLTELLDKAYDDTIENVFNVIPCDRGRTLGINDATENISKARSHITLDKYYPMFIEYLPADLKRKTTINIVTKTTTLSERWNKRSDVTF